MGESSATNITLPYLFSRILPFCAAQPHKEKQPAAARKAAPGAFFSENQWQPPQLEQLPVQPAAGSSTVIGSPPFIAVLMMASI